jgi:hypothetical protein
MDQRLDRLVSRLGSAGPMWIGALLGAITGIALLALTTRWFSVYGWWSGAGASANSITGAGVQHWVLLSLIVLLSTSLTAAPLIRFLALGWKERLTEFKGRLRDDAIYAYLAQFWKQRLDENPEAKSDTLAAERLLNTIYVGGYGRRGFITPLMCLLVVTFIAAVLVTQSGIDACIQYGCVSGTRSAAVTGHFAPMGDVTLPQATAAAIAGAYLFVVWDAILQTRRRATNISDIYWYVLRVLLAVPIGLGLSQAASPTLASLVSIGLGAFPIDALMKLLRRLTNKSIGNDESAQVGDQLVQLAGVTVPISATLAAEGVDSIDELIGMDPVLLSIRSGIPFPSVLRFASQAVVRLHLGEKAGQLESLGLANAYLVAEFVKELDDQRSQGVSPAPAEQRLLDAVKRLKDDKDPTVPSKESVEACFRQISLHGYTVFLRAVG